MKTKDIYRSAIVLGVIIVLGIALHLFRIGYPDRPVFDEAHFATYAADYATGHPFEDIHPPLGKFIFASVLFFYPKSDLAGAQFINTTTTAQGNISMALNDIPYGNFPYVALRVTSAIFGILLAIALYYLMKNIGAGEVAAFLAALFILFDNAFLMVSRLILMDAMFMTFAIAGLAFYFAKRRRPIIAGILWGLALSVKLTAIIFLGPVLVGYFFVTVAGRREELGSIIRFAAAGFAILILVALAGTLVFSPAERLQVLGGFGTIKANSPYLTAQWQVVSPVRTMLVADMSELVFSVGNYVIGNFHEGESPWYFWPAMQTPISYYNPHPAEQGGSILFVGNIVLWLFGTLAVAAALAFSFRYTREHFWRRHEFHRSDRKPFFVLLVGYLSAIAPFILIVHRSTFLYHYLPALIFAFGLL